MDETFKMSCIEANFHVARYQISSHGTEVSLLLVSVIVRN